MNILCDGIYLTYLWRWCSFQPADSPQLHDMEMMMHANLSSIEYPSSTDISMQLIWIVWSNMILYIFVALHESEQSRLPCGDGSFMGYSHTRPIMVQSFQYKPFLVCSVDKLYRGVNGCSKIHWEMAQIDKFWTDPSHIHVLGMLMGYSSIHVLVVPTIVNNFWCSRLIILYDGVICSYRPDVSP